MELRHVPGDKKRERMHVRAHREMSWYKSSFSHGRTSNSVRRGVRECKNELG